MSCEHINNETRSIQQCVYLLQQFYNCIHLAVAEIKSFTLLTGHVYKAKSQYLTEMYYLSQSLYYGNNIPLHCSLKGGGLKTSHDRTDKKKIWGRHTGN